MDNNTHLFNNKSLFMSCSLDIYIYTLRPGVVNNRVLVLTAISP